MAVATYNELITATFRDNAIRSVMMIDDDFIPYDELYDLEPESSKTIESKKAANIHRFFQHKKIICDVDKGNEPINAEKIRKCDLVILDYHLEDNNPEKSLKIIRDLSETPHMNLVVVYTREQLDTVWRQIAACLSGSVEIESIFADNIDAQTYWYENYSDNEDKWFELMSDSDLISYFKSGVATKETTDAFETECGEFYEFVVKAMCEKIAQEFNKIKSKKVAEFLNGGNGNHKWLQIGNVFVVLHSKSIGDISGDPQGIWDSIQNALIDWQPSYYRLLISEMQNRLENEPVSFNPNLAHDLAGQAAWLHQILIKSDQEGKSLLIDQLFDRLTDELKEKLFKNNEMQSLIKDTFDVLTSAKEAEKKDSLDFALDHVKLKIDDRKLVEAEVGHALNFTLCAQNFEGDYVTSGTVLYDLSDDSRWFLCVAPACETVPKQHQRNPLTERLIPHRLMKVLVLRKAKSIADALKVATRSNAIFIKDKAGKRIALEVVNDSSKQPTIDYILVKNHDTSTNATCVSGVSASFLTTNSRKKPKAAESKLVPLYQLRDMYTARFQAIASHHTGRVGVDFIDFAIKK